MVLQTCQKFELTDFKQVFLETMFDISQTCLSKMTLNLPVSTSWVLKPYVCAPKRVLIIFYILKVIPPLYAVPVIAHSEAHSSGSQDSISKSDTETKEQGTHKRGKGKYKYSRYLYSTLCSSDGLSILLPKSYPWTKMLIPLLKKELILELCSLCWPWTWVSLPHFSKQNFWL